MASPTLEAAIAELDPAERRVFLAVMEPIEQVLAQLERITDALSLLDRLDDQREAELRALKARVAILTLHATGELSTQALAACFAGVQAVFPESIRVEKAASGELIEATLATRQEQEGDYCARASCGEWIPSGEVHSSNGRPFHLLCYQAEIRQLRERRDRPEGGGASA